MPRKLIPFKFEDKYIEAMDWLKEELRLPSRAAVVRRALTQLYRRAKRRAEKNPKKKRKRG